MPAAREPPSIVFLVILLPFGVVSGFVSGALGFLLAKGGFSTAAIGALIGLYLVPQTVKFLWAPIVDGTLSVKLWHLIATAATGAGILAISAAPTGPGAMPLLEILGVMTSVAASLVGMAADSLLAHAVSPQRKGRAGGWAQAGNVGGAGIGAGGGIWLGAHLAAPWMTGAVIALAIIPCAGALLLVPDPQVATKRERLVATFAAILADVWGLISSRSGMLAIWIFVLPLGTAAAGSLLPAVARDWSVGPDLLAALGAAGGVASAVGAIAGGYLVDAMDRKGAYALSGALMALVALAMAAAARTPAMYVLFVSLYALSTGVSYGAYFGVTLEAAGVGAAATKCTLLAGLSNLPIAYMTALDGQVQTRWGSGAMLTFEAALGGVGIVLYYLAALATRRRRAAGA